MWVARRLIRRQKNVETTDVPELNVIRQIQTQTKINQVLLARSKSLGYVQKTIVWNHLVKYVCPNYCLILHIGQKI